MKYKKSSAWKRANWDKWSFWKKVRHVCAVIASLIAITIMVAAFLYVILVLFGIQGFLLQLRDTIILEIMHSIFG